MNRILGVILVLVLGRFTSAADDPVQEKRETPAEQYLRILKEQEIASSSGRVLSDDERMQFVGETFKRWNAISLKFVALAEKYPDDPIAVDALVRAVWQVNSTPWPFKLVGKDDARAKAFAILLRRHLRSDKLGPLCERISGGVCQEYETFLRAVLEKSPHKTIQAQACMALAHFLSNRLARLDLIKDDPARGKEFADLFGREYLDQLQKQSRAKISAETEALLERSAREFGDVKLADGDTVRERAEVELFEIRHLSVGKEAPDIEGEDQDGKRFKLSDYRGKVVLLDFWGEY